MTAPRITPGSPLGTGGTASVEGGDLAGVITLVTGASPSGNGSLFDFHPVSCYVNYRLAFFPITDLTAALYPDSTGTGMNIGSGVLAGSTTYKWAYRAQSVGAEII